MRKKLKSITNKLYPMAFIAIILVIWFVICQLKIVPGFMLPSPQSVVKALVNDFGLLMGHAATTLQEAFIGLILSIVFALALAVIMDECDVLYKMVYPVMVLTQTVPTVAIAPLLVLWMGFGILPKITLIFITCFFPIAVSTLGGLRSVDADMIRLFRSMGANKRQILWRVKLPYALEGFFSGLKVAATYSIVGAVISEWLGGVSGLGVYMTRVRKSYAFDKMFAVILITSAVSLLVMKLVTLLQKKMMPWKQATGEKTK